MGNDEQQLPANVMDVALWKLARTVHERHQHDTETDTCGFCGESWPCEADQRAVLADEASRRPLGVPTQRKGEQTVAPATETQTNAEAETPAKAEAETEVEKPAPVGATDTGHTPVWRRLRSQRQAG